MNLEQVSIPVWLAVFAAVGMSAERLVEVIKNRFAWLDSQNPDPQKERTRKFWLRIITILAAIGIVAAAQEQLRPYLPSLLPAEGYGRWLGCVLVGLLSSAGSDFWNQTLGMLTKIKEARRLDLSRAEAEAETHRLNLARIRLQVKDLEGKA
ncbi:MAG: hypothetical protein ACOZHQ_15615 [Thermodesulfobacteriota bacterium]